MASKRTSLSYLRILLALPRDDGSSLDLPLGPGMIKDTGDDTITKAVDTETTDWTCLTLVFIDEVTKAQHTLVTPLMKAPTKRVYEFEQFFNPFATMATIVVMTLCDIGLDSLTVAVTVDFPYPVFVLWDFRSRDDGLHL